MSATLFAKNPDFQPNTPEGLGRNVDAVTATAATTHKPLPPSQWLRGYINLSQFVWQVTSSGDTTVEYNFKEKTTDIDFPTIPQG